MSASATPRRRRRWLLLAAVILAVALAVALVWFFGGDEPEAVDAERTLQQDQDDLSDVLSPDFDDVLESPEKESGEDVHGDVRDGNNDNSGIDEDSGNGDAEEGGEGEREGEGGGDEGPDPDDAPDADPDPDSQPGSGEAEPTEAPDSPDDLDGVWRVDTSREFDRAAGLGTFVGYRIEEELSGIGSSTAVGRTPDVEGQVTFDAATMTSVMVTSVVVEADLTSLESDDRRRDRRVRSELGAEATASFNLDEPIELPVPPVGEVIELTAPGTLTLLGESRAVDVSLQAVVTDEGLLITGSTVVMLSDYGVKVPSAPIVLSASDEATLEWQLFLEQE